MITSPGNALSQADTRRDPEQPKIHAKQKCELELTSYTDLDETASYTLTW